MPAAPDTDASTPGRARRRSSAQTASTAPAAAEASAAAADAPAAAPAISRAKLLAQQLAKKEVATRGMSAAAPAAVDTAAPAAPGSAWVGADELLYAGSQAQSDSLLMGQDASMQVRTGHRACIET